MMKTAKILREATRPNCLRSLLEVIIKVANPKAVVVLVNIVMFPTRRIICTNDFDLLPCFLNSLWYLFMRKIQFGTLGVLNYDITILSALIPPLLIVIGVPKENMTPIVTTNMDISIALKVLKK